MVSDVEPTDEAAVLAATDPELELGVDKYGASWVVVNARRLFSLLSHVGQACSRSSSPPKKCAMAM